MKYARLLTLVFALLFLIPAAQAVELHIGSTVGSPQDRIGLPVTVVDFVDVAGFQLYLTYDSNLLQADSVQEVSISDVTDNVDIAGEINLNWLANAGSSVTLADDATLFVLYFTVKDGAEGITSIEFTDEWPLYLNEIYDVNMAIMALDLFNGSIDILKSGVDDPSGQMPSAFELKQNYPNPFNPSTTVAYSVDEATDLTFEVFDITGRRVDRLLLGRKPAGTYSFVYEADHLSSGVYMYRLSGGNYSQTRRMILTK